MIVVVEGRTDAAFFQHVVNRLYSGRVDLEPREAQGKYDIPKVAAGLLQANVREMAIAQDIDGQDPEMVMTSFDQAVHSALGISPQANSLSQRTVAIEGSKIHIIPMGLPDDGELGELGIKSHAVEDYLTKLLLNEPSLREKAPELKSLLLKLLPSIRDADGPFDSSKEIFQLIKPIVQHGFSDTGVVQKLVLDADENVLRAVLAPLLADMGLAFGF